MAYTTEYSSLAGVELGPCLVYNYAVSTEESFGEKASITPGLTGDMVDPRELALGIAAAKEAGINKIQVSSYSGSGNP